MTTELIVLRDTFTDRSTTGAMTGPEGWRCDTLEDVVRQAPGAAWDPACKVPGATAIPFGRYQVVIADSPHFGRPMPLLRKVPSFDGIEIHWGNWAKDTLGCLLVGTARAVDEVLHSREAFAAFFTRLEAWLAAGDVWVTYVDGRLGAAAEPAPLPAPPIEHPTAPPTLAEALAEAAPGTAALAAPAPWDPASS